LTASEHEKEFLGAFWGLKEDRGQKRGSEGREGVRRESENSYWRHREPHWTPSEGSTKPLCIEMTVLWGISYFIFKPPILRVFTGSN